MNLSTLPDEIGELANLTKLTLYGSSITSLPSSIGRLQNLTELDLRRTKKLSTLPDEIGELANLTKLEITRSKIVSLPSSIGRLQNLTELNLGWTMEMSTLPDEIGELANLTKLELSDSGFTSLPPSIGRLQNLTELNISYTDKLKTLPEEMSDLVNLTKLDLTECSLGIASILPFIGNLKKIEYLCPNVNHGSRLSTKFHDKLLAEIGNLTSLKVLDISNCSYVKSLPSSIGDLTNLELLDISETNIKLLPHSMVSLKALVKLDLAKTPISKLEGKDPNKFLMMLAKRCPLLGCLGNIKAEGREEIIYALACNNARHRIMGMSLLDAKSQMWPLVLRNAPRAFESPKYEYLRWPHRFRSFWNHPKHRISLEDAIYRVLIENPFSRCSSIETTPTFQQP
jgi:Leucine-rich repeat (LRR) protein